jgi:hypothetical protein
LGKERRQYELGYLTLGTVANFLALAIPPGADRFIVDSYCTANATKVCAFFILYMIMDFVYSSSFLIRE